MVTIKEDRLIIEIKHPLPKEGLKDLRLAIINSIQAQPVISDEQAQHNSVLLDILRVTLDEVN